LRVAATVLLLAALVACQRSRAPIVVPSGPPENIAIGGAGPLSWKAEIQIDPEVFVPGQSVRLTLLLLDVQDELTLELQPVPRDALGLAKDEHAWAARLSGGNEAFFLRIGDALEARVRLSGKIYRLRSRTRRIATFEVYEEEEFHEHREARSVADSGAEVDGSLASPAPLPCVDPGNKIDLLVLYTPTAAAVSAEGQTPVSDGIVPIVNEITTAVRLTNLVYEHSDVEHRLHLVDTIEAPEFQDGPTANVGWLLTDLGFRPEGSLEEVLLTPDPAFNRIHALRESKRADLVALVFDGPTEVECGAANRLFGLAASGRTRERAYSAVARHCSVAHLSMAHETGHNLGGGHNDDDCGDYNCGYAHAPWRTIMHRRAPCGTKVPTGAGGVGGAAGVNGSEAGDETCWRIGQFSNSNPEIKHDGEATGSEEADMVGVFEKNSEAVSRYRCKRSGEDPNVWMKDVWDDEGGEPEDLASLGKAMWQSPYIWVRHAQDPAREHEHEHQNPQAGTNYVYVKLHNNGDKAESSTLELYYGLATLNADEIEWTSIGAQPYTMNAEPGVEVVELEWTDPAVSDEGMYALLARWNTDQTPFEQVIALGDLQKQVRADNDLIWRSNDNIELADPPENGNEFAMVRDTASDESYLLVTMDSMTAQEVDWEALVPATLEVDSTFDHGGPNFARGGPTWRPLERVGTGKGKFELPLDGTPKLLGPFSFSQTRRVAGIRFRVHPDPSRLKDAGLPLVHPAYYEVTFIQLRPTAFGPDGKLVGRLSALLSEKDHVVGGLTYRLRIMPSR